MGVTRDIDGGPKLRWRLVVGVAAGLLILLGVLYSLAGNPSTQQPKPHTAAPSPSLPPPTLPQVIALSNDGRIVVMDASTGKIVRELTDRGCTFGGFLGWLSVTSQPTSPSVYFIGDLMGDSSCTQIFEVPRVGGPIRPIAAGDAPVLSPDGKRLAYIGPRNDENCDVHVIMVRDLTNGQDRRFEWPGGQPICVVALSWVDSRTLAYSTGYEGIDETRVFDVDSAKPESGRLLGRPREQGWDYSTHPVFRAGSPSPIWQGSCCFPGETIYEATPGEPHLYRLATADPDTGAFQSVVIENREGIWARAFDPSGEQALYSTIIHQRERDTNDLYRWADGRSFKLASGFGVGTW